VLSSKLRDYFYFIFFAFIGSMPATHLFGFIFIICRLSDQTEQSDYFDNLGTMAGAV
jgi:hypothetical protein